MQTLGLSQPQASAANIASGMGTPMGQQTQQFFMGTPQRPLFLPDQDPDDFLTPGRGSVGASGYASPAESHSEYLARVVEAVEDYDKQEKAEQEAKKRRIQDKVVAEALNRDTAKATLTGIYGRVQQPSSSPGAEEVVVPTQQSASSSAGAIDTDKPVSQDTIKLFETFLAQAIAEAMGRPSRPLNPVELQNYLDGLKKTPINPFDVNSQGKPYEITKYPKNEGVKISRWIGDQRLNISELQSRIFLLDSTFKFDPNASKKDLVKSYFDVYYEKNLKGVDRDKLNIPKELPASAKALPKAKAKAEAVPLTQFPDAELQAKARHPKK